MTLPSAAKTAASNAVLQGLTLVSKGLMTVGLARYLPVADVGIFGLFFATLNLSMYAVGLEFHAFSTRELLKVHGADVARLLRNQGALHLLSYGVTLPLFALVLPLASLLPWDLVGWFCALLVLEHLGQELQRALITLQRSTLAAAAVFVRQGAWGLGVPLLMAVEPGRRSLDTLWIGWTLCEAVGLLLSVWFVRDLPWREANADVIDWNWVRRGVRGAAPFLVATLALMAMRTVDRYVLRHFWGDEAVGVLTFFLFVRNAIQGLIDAGILFVMQPRIVAAHQRGQLEDYARLMRNLFMSVLGAASSLCVIAAVLIQPVLQLIGRTEYAREMGAFFAVLGLTVVASISDIPSTALYARHLDRAIIVCALLGLAAALVANLLLVPPLGVLGSVLATTVGFGAMGLFGLWVTRRAA